MQDQNIMNFSCVTNFASRYLQTYYLNLDHDEVAIADFLVEEYKKVGKGIDVLEIGCGPTIHHLIPAVPYAKKLIMADFLKENLSEIKKWIRNEKTAHDWSAFIKHILQLECGQSENIDITNRESELRSKIEVMHCDLMKDIPLDINKKFPVVSAFYCAEEVGISLIEWQKVMARITSLIEPGGYLFMCSLLNTDFYQLINEKGEIEIFPSAKILPEDFENLLPKLGFDTKEIIIKTKETPSQRHHGVNGTIMISARMNS